jgi:hypothetical protein
MDYLDKIKLKKMKNLNEISATFVVYTTKSGSVRDNFDGDTYINQHSASLHVD